ncbi:MAG: asparagine synthase (glutamine-hydrolyzing) [Planctomycetes bacterium]|nr:asparagine synthase (glutamine-hydrolyzing) [Planctomycetota bacterium]
MCGIAGILVDRSSSPPQFEELRRMAALLHHRGPDGHGFYRDPQVGLAHTRLALLDLAFGHQPLANEDESVWVVGNGEIFRHAELRAELEACGHRMRTRSDIEVVAHAFEQWGEGAFARLDGQFAVAVWDRRRRRLWLARDRLGILPLWFLARPDRVLFASEQKALFAVDGRVPPLAPERLVQAFTHWAVPAPASVFAGVESVRPGEAVCIEADLRQRRQRYWQPDFVPDTEPAALADAAARVRGELDTAVQRRLAADVPVGCYVSGGIDSAVVAALAVRHRPDLETFALRFDDPAFDEGAAQQRVVAALGTDHREVHCSDADVREHLPAVVWHCETPLLRTAPVPMFLLARAVRRAGIKAVLTGEGADELLGGYSVFQEDRVRRFWARQPASTARPALFARVHDFVGSAGSRRSPMWQAFFGRDLQATADPYYSHRLRWANGAWTARFLAPDVRAATWAADAELAAELPAGFFARTPLARAQLLEIQTFFAPYLLSSQGDRVALGNGVEVRYPFLDPEVVDDCLRLSDRRKMRGLHTKVVLRELARDLLPADVAQRPKHPYRAPTAAALLAPGRDDQVGELLAPARLADSGLFDVPAVLALLDKTRRSAGRDASEREAMALTAVVTLQALLASFGAGFAAHVQQGLRDLDRQAPTVCHDATTTTAATLR